jgi:hypothetical protein
MTPGPAIDCGREYTAGSITTLTGSSARSAVSIARPASASGNRCVTRPRVDDDVGLEAADLVGRRGLVGAELERDVAPSGDGIDRETRPAPISAALATCTRPSGPAPTTAGGG